MENQPVQVTMTLGDWVKVINIIAEHPFKVAAPIINAIQQQIQSQMTQVPAPANGELRQEIN